MNLNKKVNKFKMNTSQDKMKIQMEKEFDRNIVINAYLDELKNILK